MSSLLSNSVKCKTETGNHLEATIFLPEEKRLTECNVLKMKVIMASKQSKTHKRYKTLLKICFVVNNNYIALTNGFKLCYLISEHMCAFKVYSKNIAIMMSKDSAKLQFHIERKYLPDGCLQCSLRLLHNQS